MHTGVPIHPPMQKAVFARTGCTGVGHSGCTDTASGPNLTAILVHVPKHRQCAFRPKQLSDWDQLYLCSCCILICVNGTSYTWMHRKHLSISCGQRWLFALGMPKWLRLIPFLCSMTLTFSWAFTRCNCTPERLLMVWNSLFMPI